MKLTVDLTKDKGIRMKSGQNVLLCEQLSETTGRNITMTPIELLMAALGSSVAAAAVDFCVHQNISTEGFKMILEWEGGLNSRPITKVVAFVHLPNRLPKGMEDDFMSAIHDCDVYHLFHAKPEIHFHPTTLVEKPEGEAVIHFAND